MALGVRQNRRDVGQARGSCSLLIAGAACVCRRRRRPDGVDSCTPRRTADAATPRPYPQRRHDDDRQPRLRLPHERTPGLQDFPVHEDATTLRAPTAATVSALEFAAFVEDLRTSRATLNDLLDRVGDFGADTRRQEVRLQRPECHAIGELVNRLVIPMNRAQLVAADLGIIQELTFNLVELQEQAYSELASGPAGPARARLLASFLPVGDGCRALARAIAQHRPAVRRWESTLIDTMGAFRGSDPPFVRRLTRLARLTPDAIWAEQRGEQLDVLAAVLVDYASGRQRR